MILLKRETLTLRMCLSVCLFIYILPFKESVYCDLLNL